jgi:hypothetical protein
LVVWFVRFVILIILYFKQPKQTEKGFMLTFHRYLTTGTSGKLIYSLDEIPIGVKFITPAGKKKHRAPVNLITSTFSFVF